MPDFSSLLRKPAGEAKRPPALPPMDAPGIIRSYEIGDSNKNKTPYARLQLSLTGLPENATAEVLETLDGVDLSKRQMRRDYYLTDDALWRLDELLRSCGVESNGRSYEEVLPELVGKAVMVEVQQYLNTTSNEIGNQVGKVTGQG